MNPIILSELFRKEIRENFGSLYKLYILQVWEVRLFESSYRNTRWPINKPRAELCFFKAIHILSPRFAAKPEHLSRNEFNQMASSFICLSILQLQAKGVLKVR